MALVAGGRLTEAVSAAGGLGLLGGGYAGITGSEPDLETELAMIQSRPFGVGFITWALNQAPAALEVALAYEPDYVFLSFGDPAPFAARIHDNGAGLICQVQSLQQVPQAVDAGAGVIVAQGTEDGGHGGGRATLPLIPEFADYLAGHAPDTLLLAAGGIADGRGLAAALMLGADGVLVGSRFWASAEAMTPEAQTRRAAQASGDETVRTTVIDALRGMAWPEPYTYRVLRNRLTDEWAGREDEARAAFGSLADDYTRARERQDLDVVATVVGEAVGLIQDRPGAARIIDDMVSGAASRLQAGGSFVTE
jgi:nitronate monooxygenase